MRRTVLSIRQSKETGEKLTMLTAYDATMASLLSQCEVDMLLVGDSLGMVVQGRQSTTSVTMEEMVYHAKNVRRGAPDAFVVVDMPFGSYHVGTEAAVRNGIRLLKETGCDAVKLEGGGEVVNTVKAMVNAGVPVMAHIGLLPQTASQQGGYKVQGNDPQSAVVLAAAASSLQEAGAFAVLMECIPAALAELITKTLVVPTIGIGAGGGCDGQVLVTQDMLGIFERFTPKFVKQYQQLGESMREGVGQYCKEVRNGSFPAKEHSFSSDIDFSALIQE